MYCGLCVLCCECFVLLCVFWIVCYDHDAIGSDDLIGKCKLSLLPVFKRGLIDTWVTIKEETEWGKPKPAGADSVSVSERF